MLRLYIKFHVACLLSRIIICFGGSTSLYIYNFIRAASDHKFRAISFRVFCPDPKRNLLGLLFMSVLSEVLFK